MRSIVLSSFILDFEISFVEGGMISFWMGELISSDLFLEGNSPLPLNSQYRSTSGNAESTFKTKSKLGLFLLDKMCEILERCTPIFSAKDDADSP